MKKRQGCGSRVLNIFLVDAISKKSTNETADRRFFFFFGVGVLSAQIKEMSPVCWQLQLFCKVGICAVGFVCLANLLQCAVAY
jgi:hypothetical protein